MSGLSAYREQETANAIMAGGVWIALHTADPGNDGSSNEVDESEYSRIEVGESNLNTSGDGPTQISVDTDVTFDAADTDWGTITHTSMWDSETGGDCECVGEIPSDDQRDVTENDRIEFLSGDITFDID